MFLVLLCPALGWAAPTILVLGDSLSAAYGIDTREGWVSLLGNRLEDQGYPHRVANASISGETTRGGLTRLPELLERHEPALVVLELGGNDGLRGIAPAASKQHLAQMIELSQQSGAKVLLLGVQLPPNYGPAFTERFAAIFNELAESHDIALVPFMLEGIATDPQLMQADGIHPVAEAQPKILELVWPELEPLLERE